MNARKILVWIVLAGLVLGVALPLGWKHFFGESPEQIVKRKLEEVARTVGKTGAEGIVVEMEHAKNASKYFDEISDFQLPGIHQEAKMSRLNIQQNTLLVRKNVDSMEITFYDMTFEFNESKDRCKVLFTGMVTAQTSSRGSLREVYELEAGFVLRDGEWLISRVAFQEILKK